MVLVPEEEEKPYTGPAISQRPLSHYIRGELSAHEREQFAHAAVTGRDVLAWAGRRAWGLEVPWRVTKISVVANQKGLVDGQQRVGGADKEKKKKKKRLGKKGRIVLRKREKVKKEAAAAAEKQKTTKEEHLKEKKKRLNREKKLKRRQKEREKKAAARGPGGEEREVGSGSEGGSDGEE